MMKVEMGIGNPLETVGIHNPRFLKFCEIAKALLAFEGGNAFT